MNNPNHFKNRYDFIYLFDCQDANPNGDPDAGNLPRIDAETGQGLVTDVCLKRKIRNYVQQTTDHKIYFIEGAVHNLQNKDAYEAIGEKPAQKVKPEVKEKATQWMCEHYFDIRTFGAVMATKVNCGQVRGPVQLSFARSIHPIITNEYAITRTSVTDEKDIEKERTMGRKFTIPYGLYRAHGFINPFLAEQTGFSEADKDLLFEALDNAFQFDQSAARPAGSMNPVEFIIFKHDNQLGKAPSQKLFDAVRIQQKASVTIPRSSKEDFQITIDESAIPEGVEIIHRISTLEGKK